MWLRRSVRGRPRKYASSLALREVLKFNKLGGGFQHEHRRLGIGEARVWVLVG